MGFIDWSEIYSADNSEIDDQHKKLFGHINILFDAMKQGKDREVLKDILNGLTDYTVYHFGTEEKLMSVHNYPDGTFHKAEHIEFIKKVSDFNEGFEKGKLGMTFEVMGFLSTWLKNHILKVDRKLGMYLNEKGLK